MSASRAWSLAGGALAAAVLALSVQGGPVPRVIAQDGHGGEKEVAPDALFAERCASCHVKPDPGVATDRAFIRQLQETA